MRTIDVFVLSTLLLGLLISINSVASARIHHDKRRLVDTHDVLHYRGGVPARFVSDPIPSISQYMKERNNLIISEQSIAFDQEQRNNLTPQEQELNAKFLQLRNYENNLFTANYTTPYIFADDFYKVKPLIDKNSKLLKLIFDMPKAGVLHLHLDSFGDMAWFVRNLTYRDECYIYNYDQNPIYTQYVHGMFQFFPAPGSSSNVSIPAGFQNVNELRRQHANDVELFDQSLLELLTLGAHNSDNGGYQTWQAFSDCLQRIDPALYYIDAYRDYLYASLMAYIEVDHIQYVELRESVQQLYDIDGTLLDLETKLKVFISVVHEIQQIYHQFNAKWIMFAVKFQTQEEVLAIARQVLALRIKYPEWIVGFDLVGDEDTTNPIVYYADILLQVAREAQQAGTDFPFYFHAGESVLYTNENLYDAILLNSRRIGHGYANNRFPYLMQLEQQRNITLEVCPLSNKILGLLVDLRNHPFFAFIASGLRVTLNPDDPGVFGYTYLSYDLYASVLSFGLDIPAMKQLFVNSIQSSAMSTQEKAAAMAYWQNKWAQFVASALQKL